MKRFMCCTTLIGIGAISAMFFLSMFNDNANKTEIIEHIDNTVIEQPVEVEESSAQLQELYDKLDSIEEEMTREPEVVIVEKEVIKEVEVPVETTKTVSTSNKTYLDRPFETGEIKCEICNEGGSVETWYDVNQHRHVTHTYRCTGALDNFYGPSVRN